MKKILVVDDNEQNSDLLKDVLETWGYEVRIASQGLEVMPISLSFKPDIVLLDIMLPGMSGFEVCTELRSNAQTKTLPVIMCSVLSELEDRVHAYSVGADNYLTKPLNYNELKQILESAIVKKQYIDGTEPRLAMSKMLLDIASTNKPDLKEHNRNVFRLCERLLARNGINAKLDKIAIACNLLGVTRGLGQPDYEYLKHLNCASWLITLMHMLEIDSEETISTLVKCDLEEKNIYWEWQVIKVANFFQYELMKNKIPRKLIIDVYRKQLLEEGCDRIVLDLYEKIFIGEDLLYNIKV